MPGALLHGLPVTLGAGAALSVDPALRAGAASPQCCVCLAFKCMQPVVVDLMDVDLWPVLPGVFDAVQPGLLESLLDK